MPLYFLKYRDLKPLKDLFILGMLVTFVGGSVARRLGEAVSSSGQVSVKNEAVSGGGLLRPNADGSRHCQPIDLMKYVNDDFVVIQVGGNDFFSHSKSGKHITTVRVFTDSRSRKHFTNAIHEFLSKFAGRAVFIVGLFPRYLHNCCEQHKLDDKTMRDIENIPVYVNIDIQGICNHFQTKVGKSVICIPPEKLHGLNHKDALASDNLHLKPSANRLCAESLLSELKLQNTDF